jgi:hypothetical protein
MLLLVRRASGIPTTKIAQCLRGSLIQIKGFRMRRAKVFFRAAAASDRRAAYP